jgi:hypothetical protein
MKRILFVALLAQFVVTSVALGASTAVDFSSVLPDTDITVPNTLTLNGVTFTYDNFGSPINDAGNPVYGLAQPWGIFGIPNNGVLTMAFSAPVTGLSFDYINSSAASGGQVEDALFGLMGFSNGNLNGVVGVAGNLNVPLTFDYTGPAFTNASFYFAYEADTFRVQNIAYTLAPVPEPETYAMLLAGLGVVALIVRRRKERIA